MTDIKKSRYTEEQIIGFIRETEAGIPVSDPCRKHGFSDASFYKWRAKFGGMEVSDAKKLRDLEPLRSPTRSDNLQHRTN